MNIQINSKKYTESKTIWFNVAVAVFGILSTNIEMLKEYMTNGGYVTALLLMSAMNTYLRSITSQPIAMNPVMMVSDDGYSESPSNPNYEVLVKEINDLRNKVVELKTHAYDCCNGEMLLELDDRIKELGL